MLAGSFPEPVVLVVEDEPVVRATIVAEIADTGWPVLEAGSGERALSILGSEPRIGVLITDIRLAGRLTGWDVAEAFRKAHPEMPVVYASGKSADESRRVRGSVFFKKPFRPSILVDVCRQLIASRRA
ncbi:MAG: response regulator [Stellaceae bacterium]